MKNMTKEERATRGERRERNGRRVKNDVSILFLWRPCQRGDLESCGGLSWRDLLEKPEDWSDLEPEAWVDVLVVPDVTDVSVSVSSVVTECCDGLSCCSDRELLETQSFSFSKKACSILDSYARRDEVRKLTSEGASAI